MPRLQITDLTLRDAHQSLFATRLTTADPASETVLVLRSGKKSYALLRFV